MSSTPTIIDSELKQFETIFRDAVKSDVLLLDRILKYIVKTKGKGYTISEGDGLAYSYSVFNSYKQIKAKCRSIHLLNTQDGLINPYRTASHVALLGIKKESEPGASGKYRHDL